jgi:hypothetical protein
MLKRYLIPLLIVLVAVACDKNKLETRPSLKIKDVNTTEVFPGQQLVITLEYTDKEGDLGGGVMTYVRNRLNVTPIPDAPSNDKADTVERILPDFPKTTSGQIEVKIDQTFMDEDPGKDSTYVNDTMFFKLYVKDAVGNVSDTVTTGTVLERHN